MLFPEPFPPVIKSVSFLFIVRFIGPTPNGGASSRGFASNVKTTSLSSISLYERDQILDDLVYKSLKDLAFKSEELSKKYLSEYAL